MYVEKHVNKLYLVVLVCLFLGFNMNVYGYNSHSPEIERIGDLGINGCNIECIIILKNKV